MLASYLLLKPNLSIIISIEIASGMTFPASTEFCHSSEQLNY